MFRVQALGSGKCLERMLLFWRYMNKIELNIKIRIQCMPFEGQTGQTDKQTNTHITSVVALSPQKVPELFRSAAVCVDALLQHSHLRGFTAQITLSLHILSHL